MSNWVKWLVGLGCALAVLGVIGIAVFASWVSGQPRDWNADASIEIAAEPQVVYAAVSDLRQWPEWSAWSRDTEATVARNYTGAERGAGAEMSWGSGSHRELVRVTGPVKVSITESSGSAGEFGAGSLRIVSGDLEHGLQLITTFESELVLAHTARVDGGTSSSNVHASLAGSDFELPGEIRFEPTASGTRVVWHEHGDLGSGLSAGVLSVGILPMLESEHRTILEESLRGLKAHLEKAR